MESKSRTIEGKEWESQSPRPSRVSDEKSWTLLYRASQELAPQLKNLREDILEEYRDAFEELAEHSLEQTEAHMKYVKNSDRMLQTFLEENNAERTTFFQECRESLDGKYCALFEEDINHWFVDLLLAIEDFEAFCECFTGTRGHRRHRK